ncbi:Unknown protein sequence [Pseudomonas syringae pv. castaneae]|uniref:Uncharacterized protein n=1 Tax=Pseudomonas syringae pv. castaneae TaxID=264450 RepID=A0A0P9N7A1_PSESX|nr:Unknown protein sequence [Pseudomonas syringae pv. castaneae]
MLQQVVAFAKPGVGKLRPERLKLDFPFLFQPALELANHPLIRRIQRLDVIHCDLGEEADAIAAPPPALGNFQDAAGADDVMDRLAKGFLPRFTVDDRFQHHRRVADRHETRRLEHVHQRQRAARRTPRHSRNEGFIQVFRRREGYFVANLEDLLDVQRRAGPEALRPTVVVVQAVAKIRQHRCRIGMIGVHGRHHQQADGVVQAQEFVGGKHAGISRYRDGRETLPGRAGEISQGRRYWL